MGALAPFTRWIPEDDLLLKNAVEAGASLEALAKGAVCFSRRYTIRELQDRWHSLLYDSDTSAEASAHIVEIELSVSNAPKSSRYCSTKGKEWTPEKRKVESVRSHYYAMRKRICNEPYNSVDLGFMMPPDDHACTGNEGICQEHLKLNTEHPAGSCMLGAPMSNHFGLSEPGFDILHHPFQQMVRVDANNHGSHTGQVDSLENDIPDGIMAKECYRFAENVSPVSVGKSVGNGIPHSFEQDNLHKDIPQMLGEDLSVFHNCSGVGGLGSPQHLPVSNLFETNGAEAQPLSAFDSRNNKRGSVSSAFGGNQKFSSPVSDCSASFHQLGYSSPLPNPAIWRAMEEISPPALPVDGNLEDKEGGARGSLPLPVEDAQKMNSPRYDIMHSESKLEHGISGDELNSSASISDGDFMDLSNSLLNFTNDEELLYMDVSEKEMTDRSCLDGLNSILLGSPSDVPQDDIPHLDELKVSPGPSTCLVFPDGAYPEELNDTRDSQQSGDGGKNDVSDSEFNLPATSSQNAHSSELVEGFMFCVLNSEDPEIPCNDGVFSPTQVLSPSALSAVQGNAEEATSSGSDKQKASGQRLPMVKEGQETPAGPISKSLVRGSQVLPEAHLSNDYQVKVEVPESDSLHVASKHAGIAGDDPHACTSASVTSHNVPDVTLKDDFAMQELGKRDNIEHPVDSFRNKQVQESDHRGYGQTTADGCKLGANVQVIVKKDALSHAESGPAEMGIPDPGTNFSISDHEELLFESDNDVPYFSDIEAMILDMDLDPNDQETYFTREVSRYQYEDTKKAIIRLEQGAYSYMQRAIAAHGALAVFYGRHLKHYIRKPEVSLGRATEDVNVDIDLGREGRANKISRRQAIIKMEEGGSFYLKNLGKSPILVNSKEVATGQRFNLSSNCLIEIRGMRFVFEMNQNFARQYPTGVVKKKSMKFEWSNIL